MAEHPLLFFPDPTRASRLRLGGGGGKVRKPSAAQQRQRLDHKFRQMAASFQSIQSTAQGLEPEQVLVLETIGDQVEGLAKAAAQIPGLEWLAEMEMDDVEPEAGFASKTASAKLLPCRLYAVMTNHQAMDRLIALWDNWCRNPQQSAKRNFGPFKSLFENLKDLRRWNTEDRIRETRVLEYLQEQLAEDAGEIRFEVELWCRAEAQARERAYAELSALVAAAGGACIAQAALPEILYHGVLVKMPATAVKETINGILAENYGPLVRCENVMFFRPLAQAKFPIGELPQQTDDLRKRFADRPLPSGEPLVALLDGLPLEQHVALRGRLTVDDPDDHEKQYAPRQQQHGTAMASLAIHGDLNGDEAPLKSPVYIRPILLPQEDFNRKVYESTPADSLLVDLVHRAVVRLLDGEQPVAPTVRIVNLSVANPWQPFDRELSPLARLLDWLSWKYRILFLVSVGNHTGPITLEATDAEWRKLTDEELRSQTLHALRRERMTRRPFSPAEAVNALTVGAMHADLATRPTPDRRVDLLPGARLPSPVGTVAHGYRRSVKPEVFLPGGRQFYNSPLGSSGADASFTVNDSIGAPGLLVAAPGAVPMDLARTIHSRGSSNATVLGTRCAAQIVERLQELREEPGGERLAEAELAVLAKCLLVHGSSWGTAVEILDGVFREFVNNNHDSKRAWRARDRLRTGFLGYGEVLPERSLFCTDERVTALGWSTISKDEGHVFRFPLPPALSASQVRRRLTITLAWLTPANVKHRNYRRAQLWCGFSQERLGSGRAEMDTDTARRGTVEHRVIDGTRVLAIVDGETLDFTVSCTADAGELKEAVPYALAVTLEFAEPLGVSIWEQIRDRIRPRVEIESTV